MDSSFNLLSLTASSPAGNFLSSQLLICMVVLAIFSWKKFNTWADKEDDFVKANPPRHFTTWARFVLYAVIYTLCMEVVYLFLLTSPETLEIIGKYFDVALLENLTDKVSRTDLPLWILVFLIGILPNISALEKIEMALRHNLHSKAWIPEEARALINQFTANPAFFRPDAEFAREVIAELNTTIPEDLDFKRPDNRMRHKWFKLSYLRKKINEWRGQPEISRFFNNMRNEYVLFEDKYKKLRADIQLYHDRKAAQAGKRASERDKEYLDRLRLNVVEELDKMLGRTYQFINCGILATERMHQKRLEAFATFGLYPDFKQNIPIVIDIILKSTMSVFMVTMITTVVFFRIVRPEQNLRLGTAIIWAVLALLMFGLCIFGAVLIYRRMSRPARFGGDSPATTYVIGPVANRTIAAGVGFLICLMILALYGIKTDKNLVEILSSASPWAWIPATSAGFVVYYLSSLGVERSRWTYGALHGGVTAIVALFACELALPGYSLGLKPFAIYVTVTCGLIGFSIGFTFPEQYRQRISSLYLGPERRSHRRIAISAKTTLEIEGEQYECESRDLSLAGISLLADVSQPVGTEATVELSGIGKLRGTIARKSEDTIGIGFLLDKIMENALSSYIGIYAHAPA